MNDRTTNSQTLAISLTTGVFFVRHGKCSCRGGLRSSGAAPCVNDEVSIYVIDFNSPTRRAGNHTTKVVLKEDLEAANDYVSDER